jgi:hypothetical protein
MSSTLPKYHIGAQRADVLLRPIAADVARLAARVRHYHARLHLAGDDDHAALEQAAVALEQATTTLNTLIDERAGHE